MNHQIIADGPRKLRRSPEHQARLRQLRADLRARHARELASAGFFRRLALHWRIWREFRRERRKLTPSPGSLYASRLSASVLR